MTVLGVCGGNGVILHPFKKYLIGNIEPRAIFHSPGEKQWKLNFSCNIYKQIEQFKTTSPIDVIVGAPDCGHSSILSYSRKKSLGNPKENESLTLFIKSVEVFKPKVFMFENLPALFKNYNKVELKRVFDGYDLKFRESSVSRFGNSQINRIRLLVIGVKKGNHKFSASKFKLPKEGKYILKTSSQLESSLAYPNEQLCHIRENINDVITLYSRFKLPLHTIRDLWVEGDINQKRWVVKDRKFSNAPGVYRNLPGGYPATARKSNRQFNSKGLMMSPRELARIQGIPDKFGLYFDNSNPKYWINKGRTTVAKCPPYEIGKWFYKQLSKTIKHGN